MPSKKLTWVRYDPPFWDDDPTDFSDPILSLDAPAPADNVNGRDTLYTKLFSIEDSPNDDFNSVNVSHDDFVSHDSYDPRDPSSDAVVKVTSIYPIHFHMHNMKTQPGEFYAVTSVENLNDVFRRYRQSMQNGGANLIRRVLRVHEFEKRLRDAAVVGYTLKDVSGDVPFRRLEADGHRLNESDEVQDWLDRADHMAAISILYRVGREAINLTVRDDGSVLFQRYPGDQTALRIIRELEPIIADCSDTRLGCVDISFQPYESADKV